MANGTFQLIKDVQVGDLLLTGTDKSRVGFVTFKVANPVLEDTEQDVIVVTTVSGELVGTKNHPVLLNGEWRLLGDVAKFEQVPQTWSHLIFEMEHSSVRLMSGTICRLTEALKTKRVPTRTW
jgi:hypothetical protein